MARQRQRQSRGSSRRSRSVDYDRPLRRKPWTVLIYMCGDNALSDEVQGDFREIKRVGSLPDMHVAVQLDLSEAGARRFLLPVGGTPGAGDPPSDPQFAAPPLDPHPRKSDRETRPYVLNTGDPNELRRFLLWGLEHAPADHVILLLSGLGINPKYVREYLPPDLQSQPPRALRDEVHRRLFSICHDQTSRAMLDLSALRGVLQDVGRRAEQVALQAGQTPPALELIGLDLGASSFVEVLFEFEDLAEVFVGSQATLPDGGWPYAEILHGWQRAVQAAGRRRRPADRSELVRQMGRIVVQEMKAHYPSGKTPIHIAAIDLGLLESVTLALDSLALALMQSLGDWHVLDAVHQAVEAAWESHRIRLEDFEEDKSRDATWDYVPEIDFLPAVDLLGFLDALRESFESKLRSTRVPASFGQRQRIDALCDLTRRTREVLVPQVAQRQPLIYASSLSHRGGLSVVLPRWRTRQEIASNQGQLFQLANTNYMQLNFSKRVHWAAFVGAIQLIHEKPHALWRIISSMLADANGPARDAAISRLMGASSVVADLRQQFQSLGDEQAHTLSLEPVQATRKAGDLRVYRMRLETSLDGGTVAQWDNQLSYARLEDKLTRLQDLLNSTAADVPVAERLRSLGQRLGEDLLRDGARRLTELHIDFDPRGDAAAPHLTLQIPPDLMRYPWELMHDEQGMLGERFAFGRQVFMELGLSRTLGQRQSDTIRVLVVGDPLFQPDFVERCARERQWRVCQLPSARYEAEVVCDEFERMRDEMAGVTQFEIVPLIGKHVAIDDVRDRLRNGFRDQPFDLVHFAGHAYFDASDPTQSGWLVSDGILSAGDIRNTLARTRSPPWLVFANACQAGMDAGASANPYQRDVFGLATAFLNHGVAAYIAPLWPVDDEIARWLATRFYRELLKSRFSLGESLRRAKSLVWREIREYEPEPLSPCRALSWASFVLYGDPTRRLLQSLWAPHPGTDAVAVGAGPTEAPSANAPSPELAAASPAASLPRPPNIPRAESASRAVTAPLPPRPRPNKVRGFRRSAAEEVRELVRLPGGQLVPVDPARGTPDGIGLELVEVHGVRFWRRVAAGQPAEPLPNSPIPRLFESTSFRRALRIEHPPQTAERIVGRWMIAAPTPRHVGQHAAAADGLDPVVGHQLLLISADGSSRPITIEALESGWLSGAPRNGAADRVLLFVHDIFSRTAVQDLAGAASIHETESFLQWAQQRYRAVLGFDHPTLSKTPLDNAEALRAMLPQSLLANHRVDLIAYGRGGLVARALVELLPGGSESVRRVVLVGTPNCGTPLAAASHWGGVADVLLNLVHTDPTGWFGQFSGLLAYLTVAPQQHPLVPGLTALDPRATRPDDFLGRLQRAGPARDGVSYFAVAADYQPPRDDFNLLSVLADCRSPVVDRLFGGPHDLIVNAAHVWSVDAKARFGRVGPIIPAQNILMIHPRRQPLPPPGVHVEPLPGVHHANLFRCEAVRLFLRQTLGNDGRNDE